MAHSGLSLEDPSYNKGNDGCCVRICGIVHSIERAKIKKQIQFRLTKSMDFKKNLNRGVHNLPYRRKYYGSLD